VVYVAVDTADQLFNLYILEVLLFNIIDPVDVLLTIVRIEPIFDETKLSR
jgi:hypothetical protein